MSILKKLEQHNKIEKVSFHMPGHKSGKAFCGSQFRSSLWNFDTTELSDTDCLLSPTECIKEAEEKAAKIYEAENSFFLVNGASCGILSMFRAAFKEGDKVIIIKDCHRSTINAVALCGVIPIYINPIIHEKGFSGGVCFETVKETIEAHPDAKGVFLTSPTYFGIVSNIKEIARYVHERGMLLLCDEAHGAHFPFSDVFPDSSISQGADIAVISLHKSMPCPNQTAVLNLGRCSVSYEDMKAAVNMFQTTSPSYIFLSMIEKALDIGKASGERLTKKYLDNVLKDEHIYSFDDPFKLILDFSNKGYTGFEVMNILEKNFGIYAEMAVETCVLLMASWANDRKDFHILKKAVKYIDSLPNRKAIEQVKIQDVKTNMIMTPRSVLNCKKEKVLLGEAISRIAAREVTVFPPCIPVFVPGEEIKNEHIETIKNGINRGLLVTGAENGLISVVKD